MTQSDKSSVQDAAVIVGGGPGISSSCARLFSKNGMRVAVAARNPDKAVLEILEKKHGVRRYACDASDPAAVERLFDNVASDIGTPRLRRPQRSKKMILLCELRGLCVQVH